jgi:hypothetical protein
VHGMYAEYLPACRAASQHHLLISARSLPVLAGWGEQMDEAPQGDDDSEVRLGVKPEINAICTILIAVVAVAVVVASLIGKRGRSAAAPRGR